MTCDCDHHETCAVCVPSLHGAKVRKAALLEAAEVIAMEGLDGYADQLRLMAEGETK